MLFLFNSAVKPEYVKNVLNTLHFPAGAINMYQYSQQSGDYNYVDESADIRKNDSLKDMDVLISYIDRDQDPFVFYPLRKGKLVSIETHAGRVYYNVKLGEYAFTNDVNRFNAFLHENVDTFLYSEENNCDKVAKKGYFAFAYDLDISNLVEAGKDKWLETVHEIEKCKKFAEDNSCVFTRFSLKNGGEKMLIRTAMGKNGFTN